MSRFWKELTKSEPYNQSSCTATVILKNGAMFERKITARDYPEKTFNISSERKLELQKTIFAEEVSTQGVFNEDRTQYYFSRDVDFITFTETVTTLIQPEE